MGDTSTLRDAGAPGAGRITVDSEEEISFGEDPPEAAGLEKSQTIASPVKSAALAVTTEAMERTMRIAKAVRAAQIVSDASERPLPPAIGAELRSISALLKTLTTQYPVAERDDAEKGSQKQQCPPGMVWDKDKGECVSESKAKRKEREKALTADQKSSLNKQLDDVVQRATALKQSIEKASTTDDENVVLLDDNFAADVAGLADRLGYIAGMTPNPLAKAFALVPVDGDPHAVEKAAATLALSEAQRATLTEEIEKALDVLTETLRGVDVMREAEADTSPLPDFVASAFNQASTGLLKVDSDYTEKAGEGEESAEGDGSADGSDGESGDDAGSSDDGAGSADGDDGASEGGSDDGAAGTGTDGGDGAGDGDAVAKAIEAGITKAMEALTAANEDRFKGIEKMVEGIGTTVSKMAGKPLPPNGAQPGSEEPVNKGEGDDEDPFEMPHDGQFTKDEIQKMKESGEWF